MSGDTNGGNGFLLLNAKDNGVISMIEKFIGDRHFSDVEYWDPEAFFKY